MQKKPNIIFIVMDALRPKNLGCYGYSRNTSPNIDSLAKEGALFLNCFSSNNSTEKSVLAILSSRHVLLEGDKNLLLTNKELNNLFNSGGVFLQEILKNKGYKTYCLKNLYGWQERGFDYFYKMIENQDNKNHFFKGLIKHLKIRELARKITHNLPSKKIADKIKAKFGRNDGKKTTEDAIKIIKESKKKKENFFMWIDYADTHIPYNPKEFTKKFIAEKKDTNFFNKALKENHNPLVVGFWKGAFHKKDSFNDIIARYDSAIFYNDFLIGRILGTLKENNLLKDTIIFFFSDHGESCYEHNIYFDHHGLYDVTTHFPLIITGKDIPKNKKISGFVQHEDFLPTILDLLKIKYDKENFDGKSLIPLIKKNKELRDYVFMEEGDKVKKRAIRTKEHKYIEANSTLDATCRYCNKIHGGVTELYNLKTDPEEEENLANQNQELLGKMQATLNQELTNRKKLNEKRRIKKTFETLKNNNVYK